MSASDPQNDLGWARVISAAMPGLLVAAAGGSLTIGIAIVGFLWQQTVSLAKMNETLTMVCKQMEEKKLIDRDQDRRIDELRLLVERQARR